MARYRGWRGASVRPRYTPGSPGCLTRDSAEHIAEQERRAHEQVLSGIYGEKERARAELLGLSRIAYVYRETKHGIEVEDLLTRERYLRPRRLSRGERIERWDEELGWTTVETWEPMSVGSRKATVREPWGSPFEVDVDLLRLPGSVEVVEKDQP